MKRMSRTKVSESCVHGLEFVISSVLDKNVTSACYLKDSCGDNKEFDQFIASINKALSDLSSDKSIDDTVVREALSQLPLFLNIEKSDIKTATADMRKLLKKFPDFLNSADINKVIAVLKDAEKGEANQVRIVYYNDKAINYSAEMLPETEAPETNEVITYPDEDQDYIARALVMPTYLSNVRHGVLPSNLDDARTFHFDGYSFQVIQTNILALSVITRRMLPNVDFQLIEGIVTEQGKSVVLTVEEYQEILKVLRGLSRLCFEKQVLSAKDGNPVLQSPLLRANKTAKIKRNSELQEIIELSAELDCHKKTYTGDIVTIATKAREVLRLYRDYSDIRDICQFIPLAIEDGQFINAMTCLSFELMVVTALSNIVLK